MDDTPKEKYIHASSYPVGTILEQYGASGKIYVYECMEFQWKSLETYSGTEWIWTEDGGGAGVTDGLSNDGPDGFWKCVIHGVRTDW